MDGFRVGITPYYASLMDPDDPTDPVRMQAVPTILEMHRSEADDADPLHEDADSPAPGLTHRYPDRVLFLITDQCSMYCRHCTRRRLAGETDGARSREDIDACIAYIKRTPEVRDVTPFRWRRTFLLRMTLLNTSLASLERFLTLRL